VRLPEDIVRPERRRLVGDELFERMTEDHHCFWTLVYPLFMDREITRQDLRHIIGRGLRTTRGNYRSLARRFNIPDGEYKRFVDFLRKHDCRLPFREFR
jgi:hypothetical protein